MHKSDKSGTLCPCQLKLRLTSEVDTIPEEPQVEVYRYGFPNETKPPEDGPPTAIVRHNGLELVFRFKKGDVDAEGDVQEVRIRPWGEPLEPRALQRFAPHADFYVAFARSALRWNPLDHEASNEKLGAAADALLKIAGPGRGLPPHFYKVIATQYEALVTEGEPHPVKALAKSHHVTISAASRWLKTARERGHLEPKGA